MFFIKDQISKLPKELELRKIYLKQDKTNTALLTLSIMTFPTPMPDGKILKLNASQATFVREGTHPPGSTWSLIPMPPTLLGPCCLPGPNDTDQTPNKCEEQEARNCQGPMGRT